MGKKIVLSLDYDSHADVLFNEPREVLQTLVNKALSYEGNFIRGARPALNDYFTHIGAMDKDSEVTLFVGSNRQDCRMDKLNANLHKNGSCFPNYERLAKNNSWTFNRLLYADKHNTNNLDYSPGTAMSDKSVQGNFLGVKSFSNKIALIEMQLKDIARQYPEQSVDFYFSDDRDDILKGLYDHFGNVYQMIKLHFIQFDWVELFWQTHDDELNQKIQATAITPGYIREKALPTITKQGERDFFIKQSEPAAPLADTRAPVTSAPHASFHVMPGDEEHRNEYSVFCCGFV